MTALRMKSSSPPFSVRSPVLPTPSLKRLSIPHGRRAKKYSPQNTDTTIKMRIGFRGDLRAPLPLEIRSLIVNTAETFTFLGSPRDQIIS
ncbi:hypothetical protein NQZ68_003291 [Dissostichus eleginoides]|nr:hypothetical protein NQZ68_003291 [Dissostichus eleginoides]